MKPLILMLLALSFASQVFARTWTIQVDGSGDAPTVQAGIDSTAIGDTVLVGPGIYLENLNLLGKDIVVKSEMGPEATILDGSSTEESVVLFINGESRSAVLEGFTLTGGVGHQFGVSRRGGGVYCSQSSPTIRGNRIVENAPESKGGGLYLALPGSPGDIASPLIEDNLFEANHGFNGGGMSVDGGQPVIRGNIFKNNRCDHDGGGISFWMFEGSAEVEHNQFWENIAPDHGGGIYAGNTNQATNITIRYNLFVRNEAHGEGLPANGGGGALWIHSFSGVVANNTMVENIATSEFTCNGSGIWLEDTPADLEVYGNIIALGNHCGIECYGDVATSIGPNLLWGNQGGDIMYGFNHCPQEWSENILIEDPLFCGAETGNYTVAINSPALAGPMIFGVWTTPGCGPGVEVQRTTWGLIKTRYQ